MMRHGAHAILLIALSLPSAAAGDAALIDWDPKALSFSPKCATTLEKRTSFVHCVFELAVDGSGDLHLFIAERPLALTGPVERRIEHFLLTPSEIRPLPPIVSESASVIALRAKPGPGGALFLLWVEDHSFNPQYQEQAIFLQSYRDGVWGSRRTVLDDRAKPGILDKDDVALSVNPDGTLDVFWNDWREFHFLAGMLTMGHAGNFEKTYRRHLAGDAWATVERVQRRGRIRPVAFEILPGPGVPPEVIWSDGSGSTVRVLRSARSRDRWSVEETIGRCRSPIGHPYVFQLRATGETSGDAKVAWACSGYETTEPGTRKNDSFNDLYVSAADGRWDTGPALSHQASTFRWLWNGSPSALLVQEYLPGLPPWRRLPHVSLRVDVLDGNHRVATHRLAERSLAGTVEAAAETNGTLHVIYGEFTADSQAVMKYRRGRIRGT